MAIDEFKTIGKSIFAEAAKSMPKAREICVRATEAVTGPTPDKTKLKSEFSRYVEEIQDLAYAIYQQEEAEASTTALNSNIFSNRATSTISEKEFSTLNAFYLSLSQSRKSRAGSTFETVVTYLFEQLEYPFTAQPDLGESRPDYVLPSLEYYRSFAADCIVFTCKRTLRERWRQVVTEGTSGKAFYLATIDEKISTTELERMKQRSIYVVVPYNLKANKYQNAQNVIDFEHFLSSHLDPAVSRWNEIGAS